MRKIIQDVELLKSQGYPMQVWLEYIHKEEGISYFDGICNYTKKVEVIDHSKGEPMYIRIMDMANYSLDSLHTLRELNKSFYDSTTKEYIRGLGGSGSLWLDDDDALDMYFTLVTDTLRGWLDDVRDSLEVTIDEIKVYSAETEYRVTYIEALLRIFTHILNPNTKDSTIYGQLSNGVYYFLPHVLTEKDACVAGANPFCPNRYTLKSVVDIELEDTSQGVKRMFSLSTDNAVLEKYGELVEGLSKEVADFDMVYTADLLAGLNTYTTYTKKVARYKGDYRVEPQVDNRCKFYFDLPDKSYLFFNYADMYIRETNVVNLENDVNYQAVAALRNKQTPLGKDNDIALCKQNNICTISPLYVKSIHYTEGKLRIMIECLVQFANMPYIILTLPLCLLDKQVQLLEDDHVIYQLKMGILTVPYHCFKYLDREHTIPKKLKGMQLKVLPQRTYKAIEE